MADDTRLAVVIEANTKSMENALKRLEGTVAKSFAVQTKAVTGLNTQFAKMSATAVKAAGALAAAFSARLLVNFVTSAVKAGEAIGDAAEKLGISAEAFQGLAYAADQTGTTMDSVQAAFKGMTKFLGELERHSSSAAAELKNLGLSESDLRNQSPEKVFEILLDRIGKIEDPLRRNAELLKVFGKNGAEMAQLAQLGAQGIDVLIDRARQIGIVLSNETIKKTQDAGDALGDLQAVFEADKIKLAAAFAEAITALRDLVVSPAFQDGLSTLAKNIGSVVEFIAKLDPHVLQVLLSAAAGYAVAGPAGAAAGAAFNAGTQLADAAISAAGQAVGTEQSPKGDRLGPDPGRQRFDDSFYPPGNTGKAALVAGLKKQEAAGAGTGGGGFGDLDAQQKKYDELAASIGLETDNLMKSRREQEIANQVAKLGAAATEDQKEKIAALAGALFDATQKQKGLTDAADMFSHTAYDAFHDLITGAKSFSDVLVDVIQKLAEAVLQAALLGEGPLAGLLGTSGAGGVFGAIAKAAFGLPAMASGGSLGGGQMALVGEGGPELFVPKSAGTILPNIITQLLAMLHGGGGGNGGNGKTILQVLPSPFFDVRVLEVSGPQSVRITQQGIAQYSRSTQRGSMTGAAGAGLTRAG